MSVLIEILLRSYIASILSSQSNSKRSVPAPPCEKALSLQSLDSLSLRDFARAATTLRVHFLADEYNDLRL